MAELTRTAGWPRIAAWVTLAAVLLAALAGPLNRIGAAPFGTLLLMFALASLIAGIGAPICLIGAIRTRASRPRLAMAGAVAGLATFGFFLMLFLSARGVPPIHDISTDTVNPPAFVAVLPLRQDAPNPPEYDGPEVAAQQQAAYPAIRTVTLPTTADELFQRTLKVVEAMDWALVAAVPAEGRIEATATTAWFGFKDDIVVRIAPAADGATIDVRSKSRVGMSDLGANAARIGKLLEKVQR